MVCETVGPTAIGRLGFVGRSEGPSCTRGALFRLTPAGRSVILKPEREKRRSIGVVNQSAEIARSGA